MQAGFRISNKKKRENICPSVEEVKDKILKTGETEPRVSLFFIGIIDTQAVLVRLPSRTVGGSSCIGR